MQVLKLALNHNLIALCFACFVMGMFTVFLLTYLVTEYENQQQMSSFEKSIPHSGCPYGSDTCKIQFSFTVFDPMANQTYSLNETNMTVFLMNQQSNGLATFLGQNDDQIFETPNNNGSMYIAIQNNSSRYFLGATQTLNDNKPFFSTVDLMDLLEDGKKIWTYTANLNDIKNKSLDSHGVWEIPIKIEVYPSSINQTKGILTQ